MRKSLIVFALLSTSLSGCLQDPASRTAAGAAAGVVIADATDGNLLTGAVIGGLAGAATCGVDIGLPPCY